MEAAVGAAVHAELCRVFDEVSQVNALLSRARAVDSRRGGGEGEGAEGPGMAALPPQQPQPSGSRSKDSDAYRQAEERIYVLERQVASLQHQLRTQFQASVDQTQTVASPHSG